MINYQIPYNSIPLLEEIQFSSDDNTQKLLIDAHRSLALLNGFIQGAHSRKISRALKLMLLAEIRASYELDAHNISLIRLFELAASSKKSNDDLANHILNFIEKFDQSNALGIYKLCPNYLSKRRNDQLREKNEISYKSFNTNLTIYTPPTGSFLMQSLCKNFEKYLASSSKTMDLKNCTLLSHQLRAISPYNILNGHVSRYFINRYLKSMNLLDDFIPVSILILKQKEKYQMLLREVQVSGDLMVSHHFLLELIQSSASWLLDFLKKYLEFSQKQMALVEKYTDFELPIALENVIHKNVYLKTSDICETLNCHRQTAYLYLSHLMKIGILIEKKIGREKLYLNKELFDLISK